MTGSSPSPSTPVSCPDDCHPKRLANWLFWLVLAVGMGLRLRQYVFNRALWVDEAMLALHLTARSVRDLFRPLSEPLQIAPPGFLVPTAVLAQALPGPVEMRLRFFPFLCGTLCFLLFAAFCHRRLSRSGAALAAGFFALSAPFIYYTTELKQYASDALVALVLLMISLPCLTRTLSVRRTLALALVGSVAIWVSHPVIFVLAGIGSVLGWHWFTARRGSDLVKGGAVALCWAVSFAAFYVVAIKPNSGIQSVQDFHRDAFLPFPPHNLGELRSVVQAIFGMLINPGGFSAPVLGCLLACWGIGWSGRFSRAEKWLLLLPLVWCALASVIHRYPFTGRLLLFFAPVLLLFATEGAVCCALLLSPRQLAWLPAILLIFQPAGNALDHFIRPVEVEEIRPVLSYLSTHARTGDTLFLHHESRWGFAFYKTSIPLADVTIDQAPWTNNVSDYLPRLATFKGHPRVWLFFAHTAPEDAERVVDYARQMATRVEQFEAHGASVWLFDFSRPPTL